MGQWTKATIYNSRHNFHYFILKWPIFNNKYQLNKKNLIQTFKFVVEREIGAYLVEKNLKYDSTLL